MGIKTVKVHLFHIFKLEIGLRVYASSFTVLAHLVKLIKVEIRALQILVDILTEHLFKVAVIDIGLLILLLSADLFVPHLSQVALAITPFRHRLLLVYSVVRVLTSSHIG